MLTITLESPYWGDNFEQTESQQMDAEYADIIKHLLVEHPEKYGTPKTQSAEHIAWTEQTSYATDDEDQNHELPDTLLHDAWVMIREAHGLENTQRSIDIAMHIKTLREYTEDPAILTALDSIMFQYADQLDLTYNEATTFFKASQEDE